MRITPVSMTYTRQNLRPQNQNIKQNLSFGNFENEEIREEAKSTWLNPETNSNYLTKGALDYFDKTPLVTIKKHAGITYVVMNKDVTDKHEFKENFDYIFKNRHGRAMRIDDIAKDTGLLDDEPNYLLTINHKDMTPGRPNKLACNLYQDLWEAEENYEHKSSPKEPEYEKSDLEKINDLYGFH